METEAHEFYNAAELLAHFHPSPNALLDYLGPRIDAELLHDIAEADYGHAYREILRLLQTIVATRDVPSLLPFSVVEVLCLKRHGEPPWEPDEHLWRRGHLRRAFSCAVLLLWDADLANNSKGWSGAESYTLAQLVWSALVMGPAVQAPTASFVAWRMLAGNAPWKGEDQSPHLFFAVALLLLGVALGQHEQQIDALLNWLSAEEQRQLQRDEWYRMLDPHWLTADKDWESLCSRLAAGSAFISPPETRAALATMVRLLVPGDI